MVDFTKDELANVDITSKDIAPEPSIFQRIGEGYKKNVADYLTPAASALFSPSAWKYRLTHPFSAEREEIYKRAGAVPKFLGGMVIPQTPTEAALAIAAPGVGKLGKFAKSGPLIGAIKRGLTHAGVQGGVGAATSALTGENPLIGATQGVGSSLAGDIIGGIARRAGRDVLPITADGVTRAKARFAPPIDLSTPQPDSWLRAIVDDLPVLKSHIKELPDLMKLTSEVAGKRVVRESPLVKEIGKEIYASTHSILRAMEGKVKRDLPQLTPASINNIMIQDPALKAALTPVYERVLNEGNKVSPNTALDLIQMVKEKAWSGAAGKMNSVLRKFADDLDTSFSSSLARIDPAYGGGQHLTNIYKRAKSQYGSLKDLVWVLSKNAKELFPRGTDLKPGVNPVAWADALRQYPVRLSFNKWPRLNRAVTLGAGPGGGAVLEGASSGSARGYTGLPAPLEMIRFGMEALKPSPKAVLAPPPVAPSVLFRALYPLLLSGMQSATGQPTTETAQDALNRLPYVGGK